MIAAVVGAHFMKKERDLLEYQSLMTAEQRQCGVRGRLLHDAAFQQQIPYTEKADSSCLNQSLYSWPMVVGGRVADIAWHCRKKSMP